MATDQLRLAVHTRWLAGLPSFCGRLHDKSLTVKNGYAHEECCDRRHWQCGRLYGDGESASAPDAGRTGEKVQARP